MIMKKVIEVEFVKILERGRVALYRGNDDKYYVTEEFTQFGDYKEKKGYEIIESPVAEVELKCDLSEVNSYHNYKIVKDKVYNADFIEELEKLTVKIYNSNVTVFGKNVIRNIFYSDKDLQLYGDCDEYDNVEEALECCREDITDEIEHIFPRAGNIDEIVEQIMIYVDGVLHKIWECAD